MPTDAWVYILPKRVFRTNHWKQLALKHIEDTKREKLSAKTVENDTKSSIFRYIVSSDMPDSELSSERLSREAMVLLGAGTATTARTLSFISYYTLANPHIMERLQKELQSVTAGYPEKSPRWADLEKVVYLQAVIKEGLR